MLLLGAAKLYGRPQEVGRKHAHGPNPNRLLPPSTGWNSSPHLKPPDTESVRCGHSVDQSGAVLWVSRISTQRVVSIFPWGSTGAEFQPPSALVGQPRPPQESLAVCVCPGPDRCLQPNVAQSQQIITPIDRMELFPTSQTPRHRECEMWALGCPEWSGTVGF